ncbi:MAG: tetratricopeptide repeat protein [Pyrinomonadaceae bacterium]
MWIATCQSALFGFTQAARNAVRRTWRAGSRLTLGALLMLALPYAVAAQAAPGIHTLYGDLKVDESQTDGLKPISFELLLIERRGGIVGRQNVAKNSRYRFEDLRPGEYDIVVLMENMEVARVRASVYGAVRTDVRQDILLEWKSVGGKQPNKAGVVAAAEHYERAPENTRLFDKAEEAVKKKQYAPALTLLQQLVAADPKDFEAWTELGTVAFIQQNFAAAEDAYQHALQARPTFSLALLDLGKLRMTQKDYTGAIEVLRRAVSAQPKSADANHFLGEAYLSALLREIKQGSQNINAMNDAAQQAVNYLNTALQLDPVGKAEVHLRLADIYNALNMKTEAVAECEKFLAQKPDYPERKKIEQFIAANKKQ